MIADKAHAHTNTRTALQRRPIKAAIPERVDRIARRRTKGSPSGRPPAFDPDLCKPRNVVERCFNRLKRLRGPATRFAKRAACPPRRDRLAPHRPPPEVKIRRKP
ncbi:transposase [Actinosynnema pretiosum]|uniref:transposase n=1 Tax=Actinosynnema pretiosum TaxID=42197 RepID=UPI0012FD4DFB|nr:transposase [Actinosynnema pretiosum]